QLKRFHSVPGLRFPLPHAGEGQVRVFQGGRFASAVPSPLPSPRGRGKRRKRAGQQAESERARGMDKIVVRGGVPLRGEIAVSGSKNAALPLLFASLLTEDECRLGQVPQLVDIRTALRLLHDLGVEYDWLSDSEVALNARTVRHLEAPYELVKTMRASFLVLGPLLARFGRARVSTPGGCAIGARPVDLHLAGLRKMGARLRMAGGYVEAEADRLRGAKIVLDFPSVGATQQLMMAAALADGTTVLENAAREPENVCLATALERMGARVRGAGTPEVTIEGRPALDGADVTVIPDRL